MGFYEFTQNNSGGYFDVDDKLCRRVVIEAKSSDEANEIAENLGVYFDGCEKGLDCDCCGDRWYETYSDVDLGRINEKGWEVCIYDHYQNPENLWRERYSSYQITESPKWSNNTFRKFSGKITFRGIEEYFQFLANEYGYKSVSPDARIYYKDGRVKEISKNV